jgi:hypothetical protein
VQVSAQTDAYEAAMGLTAALVGIDLDAAADYLSGTYQQQLTAPDAPMVTAQEILMIQGLIRVRGLRDQWCEILRRQEHERAAAQLARVQAEEREAAAQRAAAEAQEEFPDDWAMPPSKR